MIDPSIVLAVTALSVPLAALLVGGRLAWCIVVALRARRPGIAAVSVAGLAGIVAALGIVVVLWFAYGMAHTGKNASTDLIVLVATVPPFFLVSFGLWFLGGKLLSRLRPGVARQPRPADAVDAGR
jgi:hypothetical protein